MDYKAGQSVIVKIASVPTEAIIKAILETTEGRWRGLSAASMKVHRSAENKATMRAIDCRHLGLHMKST